MAYQFHKHYTRDEARELVAANPPMAETTRPTARRLEKVEGRLRG